MVYSLLALFGSRRVVTHSQVAKRVPFAGMHIHSSNPVKFAVFSDQFLPAKSAAVFFARGTH
jgi:hypothetical protein